MTSQLARARNLRDFRGQPGIRYGWLFLIIIASFIAAAIYWANWAVLDEFTTGEGRVVPTSKLQLVQAWDGGVVREILVRDGDVVEASQILLRLDDTDAKSRLGELEQRHQALEAQVVRLKAEAEGREDVRFPSHLVDRAPGIVAVETDSFIARRERFRYETEELRGQILQREQEKLELTAQQKKLDASMALLSREVEMIRKLTKTGAVSEIDLLRLERQLVDARGELYVLEASLQRVSLSIEEAQGKLLASRSRQTAVLREDLAKSVGELNIIDESLKSAEERVRRMALRAPARGIVNRLSVNSLGAVVQPGSDVVEIVPFEDNLLIEVKVRPSDIGFIKRGQSARVKITAFDYLQYGWFEGEVIRIGADTLVSSESEPFYLVTVRTSENSIVHNGVRIRAIPGMIASVDILTGSRSVLQYIVSPVLKIRDQALGER